MFLQEKTLKNRVCQTGKERQTVTGAFSELSHLRSQENGVIIHQCPSIILLQRPEKPQGKMKKVQLEVGVTAL